MRFFFAFVALLCPLWAQPFRTDSLSFRYERGSAVPPAQTISLSEDDHREVQVLSTVGSWLKVSALADPPPARLRFAIDPAGLAQGIYEGSVFVLVGGDLFSIRAQLTVVDPPVFLIDPKAVSLEYKLGEAVPEPRTVYVSAYNQPVRFTAESNANWLLVTPNSAATPANLRLSVVPTALLPGEYKATITLKSDRISATIPVTLNVQTAGPQTPTFTADNLLNQASMMTAGFVAPGELIVIQNVKNGPQEEARTNASTGQAETLVGKTRVLFDGLPAPVLYVTKDQIRSIVPYEVEGKKTVNIQLEYNGILGPAVPMAVAPSEPGIFAANLDGKGQAVAAHYNPGRTENFPEQNTPSNPVKRGGILLFFFTGAGQTIPQGVTGKLGNNTGALQLPARVLIGGKEGQVVYAGPAPGQIAGISQINVQVASDTPTGSEVPLKVVIGSAESKNPVTVAIGN